MNKPRTIEDLFYDVAFMAFNDGVIALYVDNENTAKALTSYCNRNSIDIDYPTYEEHEIKPFFTYKISYIYTNVYNGKNEGQRILLKYEGKNEQCGVDILNAKNIFKVV